MGSVCSTAAPAPQEPATPPPTVAVSMAAPTVECCRTISLKREKTNKFKLASEYVSHASMGAASVLDGCPFQEEKKGNACLLIIDPQIDFHEGGSLGVPGATKDSERIAALLLKHANKIDRVVRPRPLTARTALDVARLEARTLLLSSVARRSLARWSRWTRTTRCTLRTATFGRVPTASRPTRSQ